jgi:hypothetical protein
MARLAKTPALVSLGASITAKGYKYPRNLRLKIVD